MRRLGQRWCDGQRRCAGTIVGTGHHTCEVAYLQALSQHWAEHAKRRGELCVAADIGILEDLAFAQAFETAIFGCGAVLGDAQAR